ncbi:MAG TPA: biotin/lipoyl-binding protein [Thermoplasmatales archaeon]|nr:biotin/lipoyl-binding protein [Thermoplasmatales archaeon]
MFINYEHENNVYQVSVERRGDKFYITYDNTEYQVEAEEVKQGYLKITVGDKQIKAVVTEGEKEKYVFINGDVFKVKPVSLTGRRTTTKREEGDLSSPISGRVTKVSVSENTRVKKGDILVVIEAMKMEYLIRAPYDGVVKKIHVKENDQIEMGELTVELTREEKEE